ncbi:HAD-IB family phosphatase [Clostridium butyricum]|uniref:HAD-IB family phosphatase n=1 Tax=Clostridium butyricum TaxID=1492 RepID=UPI00071BCECE|nr:HAD-IB family phosphatase [Clostridium butyricum]ALP88721.1 polysaccharide biosynthesis protein GtrA [Clostridium butyricum]ALS18326.1 polysaccharide biosynthesis protein GtrA [Clostridium butyricum]ANF15450.1 polysaccharide biosynthesis protein GtrA [Clostridium butyricum]AOR95399.1 polysaccharide biosynthesis protein GtrA [Clostridium butyricum]MDU4752253.1 HAD-IB family phosphatase [Clostridium butyricum]
MNVYDFDKTIYDGDSTLDFYFFSLKKSPMLIRFLPIQIIGFIKYMFGMYSKLQFKEKFYSFLKGIKDVDSMVELFWNENQDKIKDWYLKSKEESDVIISASPEFLLNTICRRIGIKHLIASEVNKDTGICEGENCYGEEKVLRFKKYFEKGEIKKFYSDSLSDAPISLMASERYIVSGNNILPWDQYSPGKVKKLKNIFFTKEFFTFLIVGGINTINGIVFSYVYSLFLGVNVSFVLGYVTAMTISYLLNSTLVFKEDMGVIKYIKFCISYIPNFIIQNIFVLVFYNMLQWNKLIVFALAAIVGVPVTFIIMKFFAFNKKDNHQEIQE